MKTSKGWRTFQEAIFCCLCCFRTKRRSMEKMLIISGTKWSACNREPVMVHDILSNDIPELRDSDSLEITAMMHAVKDNGDLLHSSSELYLQDDTDMGDLGLEPLDAMEGREVYGKLPSDEVEGGRTAEKTMDEYYKRKALVETKSKSEPSGKATRGEK